MAELDMYEVTVRGGYVTRMKLSKDEAETLDAKKVGAVAQAEPQPVGRPPYEEPVPEAGESLVRSDAGKHSDEKQPPAARNKARSTK